MRRLYKFVLPYTKEEIYTDLYYIRQHMRNNTDINEVMMFSGIEDRYVRYLLKYL
jgi:hypothetical protein